MRAVVTSLVLLFSCSVWSAAGAATETRLGAALPLVQVKPLRPDNHQFVLTLWAEVQPKERTLLTPQVMGEIETLHPAFVAGGMVRKGDVLLQLDEADYRVALLNAEAGLASARSLYAQEQAQAEVAQHELRHLTKQQISALALRQPQMQSALAAVKSAEASLNKATLDLQRTAILAPFDGLVVRRDVGRGQVVQPGTILGEIYSVEQAELHVPVANFDLDYLPQQRQGINANILLEQRSRQAAVVRDLGIVDSKTRMNHLVVQLDDPYALLGQVAPIRFGEYVQVTLAGRSEQQLFQVPADLLQNDQLWLLQDDMTLKLQAVEVVRYSEQLAYIRDGLHSGDKLVTTVPNFARTGMAVRLATPADGMGQP